MAVDASRAPMDLPSRTWDGHEHMIESLAKLEGKPGSPFFLEKPSFAPQKRNVYADVESPRSVVNALMSPGLGSVSPADGRRGEAIGWSGGSNMTIPEGGPVIEESSEAKGAEEAIGAAGTENLSPDLRGQQTAMESSQSQGVNTFGDSGKGGRDSNTPRKAAERDGNADGRAASSQGGAAGGDRNNDDGERRDGEGASGASEQTELARERELAFEGNQQQRAPQKPQEKQDFFTKIKLAMCASSQTMESDMEDRREIRIGWPTNVKHLVHVSFDRFRGFVGLPEEMGEDQKNAPGASLSVFGVKPEMLQVTWDRDHKHCVPIVLTQLHERLMEENGLRVEGVFRIAAESEEEEYIRSKLNKGEDPPHTEVHVLAGLIKAWFRELPTGVLDTLTPEQVAAAQKESEVVSLVKQLPDTNAALLDWAVDLMADVVEQQSYNKMNARNIAMVFAPNMTQVMDPLKALMHAVKVMNLLKVLIEKRLRERRQAAAEEAARVEREMLRLAEEEEERIRAEEAEVEREERDAAARESALANPDVGGVNTEGGVHSDGGVHTGGEEAVTTDGEGMEMRSSPLVDGTASWQSVAASVAALHVPGEGADVADRAATRAEDETRAEDGESEGSGDEFFESSESIKAAEGRASEESAVGSKPASPEAERPANFAERDASAQVQTGGVTETVGSAPEAGLEGEAGGHVATGERLDGKKDDVASQDDGVAEAMSLPVTRSELLVLVTELEKKDELLTVPEEESRAEPAVVREKVDIALEGEDDVAEHEEVLTPPEEPQHDTPALEVVEMSSAATYYKQV